MQEIILIIHVVVALFIIVLVLIQHGKGADLGASLGSSASQTVFGSQGTGSFLVKLTCAFAAVFFITSLVLGYIAARQSKSHDISLDVPMPPTEQSAAPASTKPSPNIKPATTTNNNTIVPALDTQQKKIKQPVSPSPKTPAPVKQ